MAGPQTPTGNIQIVRNVPLPAKSKGGRPKNRGCNLDLVMRMSEGDSIWEIPFAKAMSIQTSARSKGIKIVAVKLESGNYVLYKEAQTPQPVEAA